MTIRLVGRLFPSLLFAAVLLTVAKGAGPGAQPIEIRRFFPGEPIWRAKRPATVTAELLPTANEEVMVSVALSPPPGVRVAKSDVAGEFRFGPGDEGKILTWELESEGEAFGELRLELSIGGKPVASESLAVRFLPAMEKRDLSYLPDPVPAPTEMLIGAHHCPLWESEQPKFWSNVLKHPERTPVLGFYSQENPEVADWETKWAVEHGISFFIYCWYRTSQGGPVETKFGSAIHEALFKSRFVDKMKFAIMWENQTRGTSGVADEEDLMENLLPFWIKSYFTHPSYLKVDNRPVLYIYRPEFLVEDLGGVEEVATAFENMRRACRDAGFDGLHLLGEYRGGDPKHLDLMKRIGLDYTFAYCWHVPDHPTPEEAIAAQMDSIRKTRDFGVLPQVVTVSQGWSGWRDEGSIWRIPPRDYERLLRLAKDFTETLPKHELGSRMLLLDNWNEWGEGHYLSPHREHGFGYLDAVRRVFSTAPEEHEDLIPADLGMGPYDTAIREYFDRAEQEHRLMTRRVTRPDAPDGLAGWWTFDEEDDGPAAFDLSGNRLGGRMGKSRRAPGFEGRALVCDGSGVVVPGSARLSGLEGFSLECRVKTERADQSDRWILNRLFGDDPSAGFRLGIHDGRPSFQLPLTDWSHQLTGSVPLPTGRWVHLAATFDGATMVLYLDGVECGAMERPGELRAIAAPLVLGNYDLGHAAHFDGWLDDVRLYRRLLSGEEIRRHAAAPAR